MHSKGNHLSFAKQVVLLAGVTLSTLSLAQTQPVSATIDASKTGAPISKYIYGQFLEHGGNIVNEGVWAEMLEDRKFYHPITSKPPEEPPVPAWRHRSPPRHWMPIGGDEFVTMDTNTTQMPATTHRWSKSTRKNRADSSRLASPCAKENRTRAALFWRAIRVRS